MLKRVCVSDLNSPYNLPFSMHGHTKTSVAYPSHYHCFFRLQVILLQLLLIFGLLLLNLLFLLTVGVRLFHTPQRHSLK